MVSYGEQHSRTKVQSPPKILAKFWDWEGERGERERKRDHEGERGRRETKKLWKWKVVKLRWVLHFVLKYFRLKQMES